MLTAVRISEGTSSEAENSAAVDGLLEAGAAVMTQKERRDEERIIRFGRVVRSMNETSTLLDRQARDRGLLSPVRPTAGLTSTRALTRKQNR